MTADDPLIGRRAIGVAFDVSCRRCGYNLRSLQEEGRCPECGEPVADSLRSDLLWLADPAWLGRVRQGLCTILYGMAAIVLSQIVMVILVAFMTSSNLFRVAPVIGSIAWLILFGGIGWFNRHDPSGTDERSQRPLRSAMWIGVVGCVMSSLWSISRTYGPRVSFPISVYWVVVLLTSAATLVGFCAMLLSVGRLMRRVPNERLAHHARALSRTLAVALGGVIVIPFITRVLMDFQRITTGLRIVEVLCLLVVLITGGMSVRLLWLAQRHVSEVARSIRTLHGPAST